MKAQSLESPGSKFIRWRLAGTFSAGRPMRGNHSSCWMDLSRRDLILLIPLMFTRNGSRAIRAGNPKPSLGSGCGSGGTAAR